MQFLALVVIAPISLDKNEVNSEFCQQGKNLLFQENITYKISLPIKSIDLSFVQTV